MIPDFANTRRRTERIVLDCWREVLQRPVIGLDANFFDLGGTSLHAIQLYELLRERLRGAAGATGDGPEFSLLAMFQYPTVASFLDAIGAHALPGTPASQPARVQHS